MDEFVTLHGEKGMPRGRPILRITRMITDRIGLHSVLLP